MSEKFRALMIEKEEDTQTVKMVDIEDNDLMEGNVLVNVTHSTWCLLRFLFGRTRFDRTGGKNLAKKQNLWPCHKLARPGGARKALCTLR